VGVRGTTKFRSPCIVKRKLRLDRRLLTLLQPPTNREGKGEDLRIDVYCSNRKVYKQKNIRIYMGDGRTRYNRMIKLLEPLVGQKIPMGKIQRRIMIEIGTSQKIVQETLRFMIDLGLIVERDHMIFEVMMCKLE